MWRQRRSGSWRDFGFGFEMIIACLKLQSGNGSLHGVAGDFMSARLKRRSLSDGFVFGQTQPRRNGGSSRAFREEQV